MNDARSTFLLQFLIAAALVLVTAAVYWQVGGHDFITLYDDAKYVTSNGHIRSGLNWGNVVWAFTTGHEANWHPITWLSHMLDCTLFDLDSKGHHLSNLFFHLLNVVLLFLVLNQMTGAVWRCGFVAALFALHPLHVESVAWVAERKDVLSTMFWLVTMLAYVHYVDKSTRRNYMLVLLAFALGLMSKPMLVTLPFVLLLLDYWPLGRLRFRMPEKDQKKQAQKSVSAYTGFRVLLREKIPLFVLVLASSVITIIAQRSGGAVESWENLPLSQRLGNAAVSYVAYIRKMFWPSDLAVFYPHPGPNLPLWQVLGALVLLLGITLVVVRGARRFPYLAVGWFWYLGTLVPVIGLVQVGSQAMADRYTYVPLIGLFLMIAWGVPDLVGRWRLGKIATNVAGVIVIASMAKFTPVQISHWQNNTTLFSHAIDATEHNGLAHYNLAMIFAGEGKTAAAMEHYSEVLRINPDHDQVHNKLGVLLVGEGKVDEATQHFREAIRINPDNAQAHYNLGLILTGTGKVDEAITHFGAALRINPNDPEAHHDMGIALAEQGKLKEAIAQFNETLRINPNHAEARMDLERVLTLEEASTSHPADRKR
jgi:thioredoxin-like negative regulator of GroEL